MYESFLLSQVFLYLDRNAEYLQIPSIKDSVNAGLKQFTGFYQEEVSKLS